MDALAQQRVLIDGVARSLRAAAGRVECFETPMSRVLVAGGHAFKFKKAVTLPFVDCATLAARRRLCREEWRLNRRLAPELYIGVVPVAGDPSRPVLGGTGPPLDYAVWMRAFDQGALWSERLARGRLDGAEVDRLAAVLARFHRDTARAPAASAWGSAATVTATFAATLSALAADAADDAADDVALLGDLAVVRRWAARRRPALRALATARKAAGMVRECHGDLHCNNIVTLAGEVKAFDCIEFDAALRWIDVIDDVAFAYMDLACRGRPDLAARLLNAYLEQTGDYAGLALLPHYRVHRALVRARVMLLRAHQPGLPADVREASRAEGRSYLRCARRSTCDVPTAVIAMHGYSGSGKTTVARLLVEGLGAVQLRSDVERKRLQPAAARDALYGAGATCRTYARLCELARTVVAAGWPVVVDAACLRAAERGRLRAVAAGLGVPFLIVDVRAPPERMRARIAARRQAGRDASDADAAVLERQLAGAEPLSRTERARTVVVDTGAGIDRERLRRAVAGAFQAAHVDVGHMPAHDGS
jgi:aminoglycoside phosphotransferase family enzyme/predicted kinase